MSLNGLLGAMISVALVAVASVSHAAPVPTYHHGCDDSQSVCYGIGYLTRDDPTCERTGSGDWVAEAGVGVQAGPLRAPVGGGVHGTCDREQESAYTMVLVSGGGFIAFLWHGGASPEGTMWCETWVGAPGGSHRPGCPVGPPPVSKVPGLLP